jgi:hypothetical protein|tara:strand:+ start:155 stop:421 length:267 start_codon:yes stop_codon:yes gene_type:complete
MKQFLVNIWAYDHHAKFSVLSEDNPASLEQAIVDKLGEKSIVWETTGMYGPLHRITYEEVINGTDDATLERPLYTEEGSRSSVGAGTS